MNELMQDKFFCSAKTRPVICKLETNACCFNCEFQQECIKKAESYNKSHKIKCTIPCSTNNIGPMEICEFVC